MPFRPNPLAPFPAREGENLAGFSRLGEKLTLKTLANHQPTGWVKLGSRGRSPMAGGRRVCPPQIQKRGRGAHINKPATSGAKNAGKPSAYGGWHKRGSRGRSLLGRGCGGLPTKPKDGASRPLLQPSHEQDKDSREPQCWERGK